MATLVAIAAIVWALTLRSDRDDAQAEADRARAALAVEGVKLSNEERDAAAKETKEEAFGDRVQARYRTVRNRFVSEQKRADDLVGDVDRERTELTQAQGQSEDERARLAAVQAQADVAAACARGVVAVMDKFFEASDVRSGADAALTHLEKLQDKCRKAVSET